jgi:hypothetical protein
MNVTELRSCLKDSLESEGYKRLSAFVFRANRSTQVIEHFLHFYFYGVPLQFLHADFAIRNMHAQNFAIRSVQQFMPANFETVVHSQKYPCLISFSLGRCAGWGIRESLDITQFSPRTFREELAFVIRDKLLPIIGKVTDLQSHLEFLEREHEQFANHTVNWATKLAYQAYLHHKLHTNKSNIERQLLIEADRHATWLHGQNIDPTVLVKKILLELEKVDDIGFR